VSDGEELEDLIRRYHEALGDFMRGDSVPAEALWSRREDTTLGNPFGPFARGFGEIAAAMRRAAANYRDGAALGFDRVATNVGSGMAYIVEMERLRSKVGGAEDITPVTLRVTTIFWREEGSWRLLHRHADPITATRGAESVLPQL